MDTRASGGGEKERVHWNTGPAKEDRESAGRGLIVRVGKAEGGRRNNCGTLQMHRELGGRHEETQRRATGP